MLTEKELKVVTFIKEVMDTYGDGFSDVMMDDLVSETGYDVKSLKGVLGSLSKKNFVYFDDVNDEYFVYGLTFDGFKALGVTPDYPVMGS